MRIIRCSVLFLDGADPEQRNKEMSGNRQGSRRLFQTGCAAVQRSELEDPVCHKRPLTDWHRKREPNSATKTELVHSKIVFCFVLF